MLEAWCCPECQGFLTTSAGHIVCRECGLVVSREYVSPTYQLGDEQDLDRPDASMYASLGNRPHIVDGLGSYIGYHRDRYFRDASGKALPASTQKRFLRLKAVYGARVRVGSCETRYRTPRTLNRVAQLLMLGRQVRDRGAYLYKKITADGTARFSNNIVLMAVCLLVAIREFRDDAPITLEELASAFERCGHRVSVRAIVREAMKLKLETGFAPDLRRPEDYVPRVLSMLLNNEAVVRKAAQRGWGLNDYGAKLRKTMGRILDRIPSIKRGGRNPFIFAVSVAYAADRMLARESGRRAVLTQKLASLATEVAEYSIRDHYGVIKRVLAQDAVNRHGADNHSSPTVDAHMP